MKQREGIKFDPTPEEIAQQQRELASVFQAQAAAGCGVFTPGRP
jgi:hypothetical protein